MLVFKAYAPCLLNSTQLKLLARWFSLGGMTGFLVVFEKRRFYNNNIFSVKNKKKTRDCKPPHSKLCGIYDD